MDMPTTNNEAIAYCWQVFKPSYQKAAGCAHAYISEFTRKEIERQREYNKKHPLRYYKKRIITY